MSATAITLALAALIGGGLPPVETARFGASDPQGLATYGAAVAMDGTTAVVGAYNHDTPGGTDTGAAYVLERDPSGAWVEVAVLTASDGEGFDELGRSVAIHGDTVVVGAHLDDPLSIHNAGSAYVFERHQGGPNAWGEVTKLVGSTATPKGHAGQSVSIFGDTIVVGADDEGKAYIFERNLGGADAWGEARAIDFGSGKFGAACALEGDLAIIGAPYHGSSGAAYVYERNTGGPGQWGQVAVLASPTARRFGVAVALSGGTAVIGASNTPIQTEYSQGSAHVFDQGFGFHDWYEVAFLKDSDGEGGDQFGISVAISGNIVVVGAQFDEVGGLDDAGSAHWFGRDEGGPGVWGQIAKLTASDGETKDHFGSGVALEGSIVLVGAQADDHSGLNRAGSVYESTAETAGENYCTAGLSASGCQAIMSVSGVASATATSGFNLIATTVEGAKDGLFFYGPNGRQANPWGSGTGFVCVIPPRLRSGLIAGVGTPGQCDGSFTSDVNARWCATCPKPIHNPGAGALMQAQLWYRDPLSTSNQTSGMSDAIEFCVGP
jgi:hypothetical protein